MSKEHLVEYLASHSVNGQKISREDAVGLIQHTHDRGCFLCGKPTHGVAIWETGNQTEVGGIKGKQRIFIYALCKKHPANEKTMVLVEKKILGQFSPFDGFRKEH